MDHSKSSKNSHVVPKLAAIFLLLSGNAVAQFSGSHELGDHGVGAGTQPPPGNYFSFSYMDYDGDQVLNNDGEPIALPAGGGGLGEQALAFGWEYVSEKRLLGGNYGFIFSPGVTNNALEIPVLASSQSSGLGPADTYIQPINLGWHVDWADFTTGAAIYVPTGRYSPGANDNTGLGMWTIELSAGTTVYLDESRTWSASTIAFYEFHSKKKDTDIRVGDILTLEGGVGKSFLDGTGSVGVAYYAQWKVTDDSLGGFVPPNLLDFIGKNRVWAAGPDITVPLGNKKKLFGQLNLRYFWESGARSTVEGQRLLLTVNFLMRPVALN